MVRSLRVVIGLTLAALVLAACSGTPGLPDAAASSPTASPALPFLFPACIQPGDGTPTRVTTSGGNSDGILMGSGPRGVVIAHQVNDGMCDYIDLARHLVARGYHVALYGQIDAFEDVPAWTDALAGAGATKIVLLGASIGAMAALSVASDKAPPVTGVISLSALSGLDGNTATDTAVAQLKPPVLFVAARDDPDDAGPAARGFMRECPSKDKKLVLIDGGAHGISTTLGATGAPVRAAIFAFIDQHTR